jgi:YHS domain-containing protein
MAKDPVCGMEVEEAAARWTAEHNGSRYYFCAPGCKRAFEKDPEKWLGEGAQRKRCCM